jgi:hypothetical protein
MAASSRRSRPYNDARKQLKHLHPAEWKRLREAEAKGSTGQAAATKKLIAAHQDQYDGFVAVGKAAAAEWDRKQTARAA